MRTLIMLLLTAGICRADYSAEYVWYRAEPELSQIVITWEHLRGYKAVNNFVVNKKQHEAEGKFQVQGSESGEKTFVREEQMDGHTIQTTITLSPPRENLEGGMPSEAHVVVYFDGLKRIDCPFGFKSEDHVTITTIVIYTEDESATVSFRNEVEKLGREALCLFDGGDEMVTYEYGLLRLIPYEECGPREVHDGETIAARGRLFRESFPGAPNYKRVENGDEEEVYWFVDMPIPISAWGEDVESGDSYLSDLTHTLQLVLTTDQHEEYRALIGRQIKVSGEVFIGHDEHHHTPLLLDLTRGGSLVLSGDTQR